jgi:hypothetical protein
MIAGKETRHSGGIVVFGSCLQWIGILAVFAAALFRVFKVGSFLRPELLAGYPPKAELISQWLTVTTCLGAGIVLLGGHLARRRKTLTCDGCGRVVAGGAGMSLLRRAWRPALCLWFLVLGGYGLAQTMLRLDLPRFEEQSSAVWNTRLAAEFDAWAATQPEGFREAEGWSRSYTGPVAAELEAGGAAAKAVLTHLAEHGGTEAAGILLLRMNPEGAAQE